MERLRASNPELPITILSGFDRQGELPVQQQTGSCGFLQKAFLLKELLQIARCNLPGGNLD